jgi:hypothetical protein
MRVDPRSAVTRYIKAQDRLENLRYTEPPALTRGRSPRLQDK